MTRVLAAQVAPVGYDFVLRFAGLGETESEGWQKGSIADPEAVANSLRKAVAQAERQTGASLDAVVAGVGGPHIRGIAGRAVLPLSEQSREVTHEDVRRVVAAARELPLPDGREILHILPQSFALDSQSGVRDPIGMQAQSLGAAVHLVTGSAASSRSVVSAVNRAEIVVETVVAESLAVCDAVLTQEERQLGSLVVLLGKGSTELAAYFQGSPWMSSGIPVGGDHFTNDIAVGLHASPPEAETIKTMFGCVYAPWSHDGVFFEVPELASRSSRTVRRKELLDILQPRAQEVLGLAFRDLRLAGLDASLGGGVVLAGGGARLQGICDLTEQIFSSSARIGLPSDALAQDDLPADFFDLPETLNQPEYTTVVSLLLYGFQVRNMRMGRQRRNAKRPKGILGRKAR